MNIVQRVFIAALLAVLASCSRGGASANVSDTAQSAPEARTGEPNTAVIAPEVAQQSGIATAVAGPAPIRTSITLFGNIQTEPNRVVEVTARFPGVIRTVHHQIGDRVQAGEKVATVESNESLQVYSVVSPIAGVITQRHANSGEVAGSEPLFEVVDASKVRADLNVFPQDRGKLRVGQKVQIASTEGDTSGEGTLSYIAPLGSTQTQSVSARVPLDNRLGRWAPGQFVNAEVFIDESRAAVTVTPSALQQINDRPVIFVQTGQGFAARAVQVGRRASDAIEITSGLKAGERYVAKNSFLVKAEVLKGEAEED